MLAAHLLARRTGLPSAVLLVVAGVIYAQLPGPNLTLDPDVVLVVVIPPLLYAAALGSSLVALRGDAGTISSLSIGLVLVTSLAIGFALHAVVPQVPLAIAIAVGAAVSPPDPVAALSVGRKAGLPARLITLVEGEGLLNDAVALTTLQVAVAVAVGEGFSVGGTLLKFLLAAAGGAAVGFDVAVVVAAARNLLDDSLLENRAVAGHPVRRLSRRRGAARLRRAGRRDRRAVAGAQGPVADVERLAAAGPAGVATDRVPARGFRLSADRTAAAHGVEAPQRLPGPHRGLGCGGDGGAGPAAATAVAAARGLAAHRRTGCAVAGGRAGSRSPAAT